MSGSTRSGTPSSSDTTRCKTSGELAERHRRQRVRWLWTIIEDRLRQAVREHPDVRAIRDDLEAGVLAGTIPPEVAARRILEAFGLADRDSAETLTTQTVAFDTDLTRRNGSTP